MVDPWYKKSYGSSRPEFDPHEAQKDKTNFTEVMTKILESSTERKPRKLSLLTTKMITTVSDQQSLLFFNNFSLEILFIYFNKTFKMFFCP